MEESWLLYFFHSIWQTVPLWLKEPSSSWLLAIELGSPKEHNTGIRPNHSVLGMVLSALKSLWCHKLVYNCAAASAVAAECICHTGSADINTIVILGAGILFSAILYLLHWTVLNLLLPELDSETKSSAGVWNCPPDDCLLLFLLWVFFFSSEVSFWIFHFSGQPCVPLHCGSLSKSLKHGFLFIPYFSCVRTRWSTPVEITDLFTRLFSIILENGLVLRRKEMEIFCSY